MNYTFDDIAKFFKLYSLDKDLFEEHMVVSGVPEDEALLIWQCFRAEERFNKIKLDLKDRDDLITILINERDEARVDGRYEESDRHRRLLEHLDVEVRDVEDNKSMYGIL